ncbi:hypothetical protein MM26B8_00070 [Mycoplasmopsis meleagridis]|uniref:Uncharacterized protein n=1 Tax=Mycoplasmopsis meleagridis ATCC 25294 TaxID=1264554 RepID=A0A0F5H2L5_9BACT|nr:hypothetical protein MMELEA_02340 [Mycoplasmopsis meleagridis ATCC 25294]OAD18608.1 hypothetical protein MM26B8_00070 [Mycoplasmopsis meleagridis]
MLINWSDEDEELFWLFVVEVFWLIKKGKVANEETIGKENRYFFFILKNKNFLKFALKV